MFLANRNPQLANNAHPLLIIQIPLMMLFAISEIVVTCIFAFVSPHKFYSITQGERHTQVAIVGMMTSLMLIGGIEYDGKFSSDDFGLKFWPLGQNFKPKSSHENWPLIFFSRVGCCIICCTCTSRISSCLMVCHSIFLYVSTVLFTV